MRAVIPAAGIGTRLRPHTLNKPKALLPVAGKPILGHIVDDLDAAGIEGFVVIVGYHQEAVREWFARERPGLSVEFVEQTERLGLGHAIWTAQEALAGEGAFFCILGDTILKADYGALLGADRNVIAVREVEDPRRFGVVEMEGDRVARFVEKPDEPRSNLAIVGAYLFLDGPVLLQALDHIVRDDRRTKGEYQLTDALQIMVEEGRPFGTVAVRDWFDCGKPETWLETSRALLDQMPGSEGEGIEGPCFLAPGVRLASSRLGPYVSIGPGSRIENCELSNCVVGADTLLSDCRLTGSLVGDHCVVRGARGKLNLGDHGELELDATR